MKVLLVTSEVTYVPGNYFSLFEELLARLQPAVEVSGLVVLRGLSRELLRTVAGLYWLRAHRVARSLTVNIATLPLRRRERLFRARGIPVLRADGMNEPWIVRHVRESAIDLVVNLRTRCIYRKEILQAPRLGCINVHHGILPRYRGTLCDLYALSEGRPAGFTVHVMNEEIDAGPILVTHEVSRAERDYSAYLARTGREEGRVVACLLNRIAVEGRLPEGSPNVCDDPVYTRTPRRTDVERLRSCGMML